MRIGSRIKTWWQKRSTKYAAAGTLLLALAGAALALGFGGNGVRVEAVELGVQNLNLQTDPNDGAYLITNANELNALRMATADQTEHTFRLDDDIPVSSITDAATGTFSGEFDGAGHVISIADIEINDSTDGEVSHGILFGTVAEDASVHDLIIDITDEEASYTRTSKVEHGEGVSGTPSEIPTGDTPQPTVESGEFSIFSDGEKAALAASFDNSNTTYYITEDGSVTTDPNGASDSDVYVREEINQDMVKTTTYELGEAGDDAFGVLCGTLETDAEISQVMVTGSGTLNITQNASEVSYQTTQTGSRDQYFYYQRTQGIELAGENV